MVEVTIWTEKRLRCNAILAKRQAYRFLNISEYVVCMSYRAVVRSCHRTVGAVVVSHLLTQHNLVVLSRTGVTGDAWVLYLLMIIIVAKVYTGPHCQLQLVFLWNAICAWKPIPPENALTYSPAVQWAAVSTVLASIRNPPQNAEPKYRSKAWA